MKFLIALFVLIGSSWALLPGKEYRYNYEGKIGMGIPEIRNKYSGAGIKATVMIQVFDNKKVIFKFSNIEVGEFLGDIGVKMTNPVPMKYVPLKKESMILEEAFEVNFNNYQNEELVVPKADIEWIVNIRKSVVQLFFNEPLRGNFGFSKFMNSNKVSLKAFTLYEPTIFGTCSLDYTLVPVGVTSDDVNMERITMNKDEKVYMLTRTINFDKCHDKVSLMYTNVANVTNMTNTMFGSLSTRSSIMTMKLIGKPGHFVIYEGKVNGFFSLHPFGVTQDKLLSFTNQTLFLESTNKITNKFVVPTPNRVIKTIYTEVWSPFKAPVNPVSYINYNNDKNAFYQKLSLFRSFTGIPIEKQQVMNYKNFLTDLIKEAAQLTLSVTPMTNMKFGSMNNEASITTFLEKATYFSVMVDINELETIFETYYNDKTELGQMKLKLFIDVCATSGYYPIKMLLNEMTKGRITPERITSIFTTFTNTFDAAPLLHDIMTYVKTLDFKTNPVMTSNVYLNFATILRKSCVDYIQGGPEYYGAESCDIRLVTEQFIPFMKQKFETFTETFERRSIIKALSNLRVVEAVKFLMEIATGNYELEVREFAIFGLRYNYVKHVVHKDDIFNALMPIVQNIKEDSYLRQIAITVLVTYRPSPTWWQRLAASTWRDPSINVGSFIYYMIKGYSHNTNPEYMTEEKIAKFLLPITKPYSPSSTTSYVYGRYVPDKFYKVFYNSAVYKDDLMNLPRNIYTKYIYDTGDFTFPLFETMFMRKSNKITTDTPKPHWSKMFSEKLRSMKQMSPDTQIVQDILSQMTKVMNQDMKTSSNIESTLFTIFENLHFMFPVNLKTTQEKLDFFGSLLKGTSLGMTKYFDAMKYLTFLPTEIGLPFFVTFNSPIFFSLEGDVKLNMGGEMAETPFNPSLQINTNFKFVSKFMPSFQAFTPWNEKTINTGVESTKMLNIPVKITTMVEYNGNFKNVSFEIMPTYNKEFTAASISNIPYVGISKVYPESLREMEVFEVISMDKNQMGLYKNNYDFNREYTGIDASIRFRGDIPFPFTYGNFYYYFNNPSRIIPKIMSTTSKYFKTDFVFNFGTSESKVFYPSIAFSFPSKEETNMIHKMKTEGEESTFLMKLFIKGSKARYFETNFQTKVLSKNTETKRTEYVYKYVEQLPGMKPQVVCFNVDTKTPVYVDYKTLLKMLTANTDYTFVGKVGGGYSCKDSQFATLKGSLKISNEMRETLIDLITKELNINKYSKLDQTFETLYDRLQFLIEYKEPLPPFFTNMTYHTYDILRGSQFPYVYTNYYNVKNPKGRVFVEGEKYVDGTYNLRVQLPTENMNLDRFEIPFMYKFQLNFFDYNGINEIPLLRLFNDIFF